MRSLQTVLTSAIFAVAGASAASAAISVPAYVDAKSGADSGTCTLAAPCATLNYALSQISANGQIIFLTPGSFGPIRLTASVNLTGLDPSTEVSIQGDPSASVGCIGAAPGSCGSNSGYAVEFAGGPNDILKAGYLAMTAGPSGSGAFLMSSGGKVQLKNSIFRGNGAATTPIVALYPNNGGTPSQAQVYFANNDVAFNNGNAPNGGAVEVKPVGVTSFKLHFNHVEVHNAGYGIRTDGSSLSNSSVVVSTFISECEFFSFNNAAVNAFSTSGTGTVSAVFDFTRILNSQAALKANGPQSFVILTNNTVSGNSIGLQVLNGASVASSGNNTIFGNGTNVSGTFGTQPLQ